MSNDMSYTTEEIAKLLKISKLTVYDLIKKGELPSYRVGKQMRVDAADLEAYKQRTRTVPVSNQPVEALSPSPIQPPTFTSGNRPIVITGHDISLDILAKHMEQTIPAIRPLRSFVGSLDSLISMYRGESDIVSTHLLDGDTGEYNLPYIRKLLVGSSYVVVNLLSRNAGLYVQPGNPFGLRGWSDLDRPGLRFVNREKGSGARVLLDEQLRLHGINPEQLSGYDHIQTNHLGVATKVATGEADVGVGIEKAASIIGQIDFIPLIQERYDLVILKTTWSQTWIPALLQILQSDTFQKELRSIPGFDVSRTGEVLFET
ncbi:helix-turn-helix transcriptional regulator [Paenibacillus sp. FSL H8-0457]|uniref:helix-turn-helix transcriptional regulator n=1 Tax=unclassified Paenibacillus TaxID=185978 RepID=UPI0003E1EA73|nr:helix-turn-helix transcriptional regulator [Paenibacillus sp. FSL H8-457]ETT66954.1 excisionase family DNA-binding domain-containing protein [Paenibacillus sp. FSL H8-457]